MTWETDRKARLPDNWKALVGQVKQRAKGRCEWRLPSGKRCPRPGTDCDHRRPGDDHRLENLQWLCTHHHAKKSAMEGVYGRRAKRAPRREKRRIERDPGRLR